MHGQHADGVVQLSSAGSLLSFVSFWFFAGGPTNIFWTWVGLTFLLLHIAALSDRQPFYHFFTTILLLMSHFLMTQYIVGRAVLEWGWKNENELLLKISKAHSLHGNWNLSESGIWLLYSICAILAYECLVFCWDELWSFLFFWVGYDVSVRVHS